MNQNFIFVFDTENIIVSYKSDKNLGRTIKSLVDRREWNENLTCAETVKEVMDTLGVEWELTYEASEDGTIVNKGDQHYVFLDDDGKATAIAYKSDTDLTDEIINETEECDATSTTSLIKKIMGKVNGGNYELLKAGYCYAC